MTERVTGFMVGLLFVGFLLSWWNQRRTIGNHERRIKRLESVARKSGILPYN